MSTAAYQIGQLADGREVSVMHEQQGIGLGEALACMDFVGYGTEGGHRAGTLAI
jgi:hypothetical protein